MDAGNFLSEQVLTPARTAVAQTVPRLQVDEGERLSGGYEARYKSGLRTGAWGVQSPDGRGAMRITIYTERCRGVRPVGGG